MAMGESPSGVVIWQGQAMPLSQYNASTGQNVGGVNVVSGTPAGTTSGSTVVTTPRPSSIDINEVKSRYAGSYGGIAANYATESDLYIAARQWYGDSVNVTGSLPRSIVGGGSGRVVDNAPGFSQGQITNVVVGPNNIGVYFNSPGADIGSGASFSNLSPNDQQAVINYAAANNINIYNRSTYTPVNPVFTVNGPVVVIPDVGGDSFEASRAYLSQFPSGTPVKLENSPTIAFVWQGGLINSGGRYYTGYGPATPGNVPGGITGTITGVVQGPADTYNGPVMVGNEGYGQGNIMAVQPTAPQQITANPFGGLPGAVTAQQMSTGRGGAAPLSNYVPTSVTAHPMDTGSYGSRGVAMLSVVPYLGSIQNAATGFAAGVGSAIGGLWNIIPTNQDQMMRDQANAANAAQGAAWAASPDSFNQYSQNRSKYNMPVDPASQGYTPVKVDVKTWNEGNTTYEQYRTIYLNPSNSMGVIREVRPDDQKMYTVGGYNGGVVSFSGPIESAALGYYNYLGDAQQMATQKLGNLAIFPNIVMATAQSFAAVPLMTSAFVQGAPVMRSLQLEVNPSDVKQYNTADSIMQSGFVGAVTLGLVAYTPTLKQMQADFPNLRTSPNYQTLTSKAFTINEFSTLGQVKTAVVNANEFSTLGQVRDVSISAAYRVNNAAIGVVQTVDTAKSVLNPFDNQGSQIRYNKAWDRFQTSSEGWKEYNTISTAQQKIATEELFTGRPNLGYERWMNANPASDSYTFGYALKTETPPGGTIGAYSYGPEMPLSGPGIESMPPSKAWMWVPERYLTEFTNENNPTVVRQVVPMGYEDFLRIGYENKMPVESRFIPRYEQSPTYKGASPIDDYWVRIGSRLDDAFPVEPAVKPYSFITDIIDTNRRMFSDTRGESTVIPGSSSYYRNVPTASELDRIGFQDEIGLGTRKSMFSPSDEIDDFTRPRYGPKNIFDDESRAVRIGYTDADGFISKGLYGGVVGFLSQANGLPKLAAINDYTPYSMNMDLTQAGDEAFSISYPIDATGTITDTNTIPDNSVNTYIYEPYVSRPFNNQDPEPSRIPRDFGIPPVWSPSMDNSASAPRTPASFDEFGQAYVNFDFDDGYNFMNSAKQPRRKYNTKKGKAKKR